LLDISRETLEYYFKNSGNTYKVGEKAIKDPILFENRGTFVTLTIYGRLRGCIGSILPSKPLILDIIENTINAAFDDPRFVPLSKEELPKIEIEISVLTVPVKLKHKSTKELLDNLRPLVDGVIIRRNYHQATFLPQVWEQLPDKEMFLNELCLKAGLPLFSFKCDDLEVYTYQVEIIK
jgi:uncharacterized protein